MTMDMMRRDIREIPLDLIKLDQENVRFGNDEAQNQREAIDLLMADPEDARKLLRLAQHIAEFGLDPTELQLVTPDDDGGFIVLEGNRRLTALKLLQRPDLCPSDKVFRGFLAAHDLLAGGVPATLQCSVVPTRAEGDMWIELKHTGQNNGVGRVGWDSNIRDERRARQTGIESIGRQIRNLVKDNPAIFTTKAISDVFKIPVTTITRLFSSLPAQNAFQLKIENRDIVPAMPLEFIAPAVEFALDMFVNEGYNVNDIRNAEDRTRFVSHIPPELNPKGLQKLSESPPAPTAGPVTQPPSVNGVNPQSPPAPLTPYNPDWSTASPAPQTGNEPGQTGLNPTDASGGFTPISGGVPENPLKPPIRAKPISRARKFLISFSLDIPNTRINAIYRDLRKTLVVDECPNAVAITFRVFIEVSCDDFIRRNMAIGDPVLRTDNNKPVKDGMRNDSLAVKVQSIAKHLEGKNKLSSSSSKAIVKRASSFDSVGSVDHFNLFVHSDASAPLPSELKDIADEYKPFLEAIWS
jgi:hypothetical protein